jgi:hypothetical protein
LTYLVRATLDQHFTSVQNDDTGTSLGLVQVRGAKEHSESLVIDQLQDDFPQFAPRQRIDTHCGLIQKQKFRRADKGAGEPKLLLHAAR